jgi:hypothetical protein
LGKVEEACRDKIFIEEELKSEVSNINTAINDLQQKLSLLIHKCAEESTKEKVEYDSDEE